MHQYESRICWNRSEQKFIDNRYSRAHEWKFDGGLQIPASSSPLIVPVPMSDPAAVDPEEALVAAVSSCHMLFFLSFAAKRGLVIDQYVDNAVGIMDKNDEQKVAMTRITLHPQIIFAGESPSREELEKLHHRAHEECYIASSLKAEIVVEIT